MYELKDDIFYKHLENYMLYVDYCVVKDDMIHRHEMHGKALLFAIQKLCLEQYGNCIKANAIWEKEGKDLVGMRF